MLRRRLTNLAATLNADRPFSPLFTSPFLQHHLNKEKQERPCNEQLTRDECWCACSRCPMLIHCVLSSLSFTASLPSVQRQLELLHSALLDRDKQHEAAVLSAQSNSSGSSSNGGGGSSGTATPANGVAATTATATTTKKVVFPRAHQFVLEDSEEFKTLWVKVRRRRRLHPPTVGRARDARLCSGTRDTRVGRQLV